MKFKPLRIFLSLSPYGNSSVPESQTWTNNLYKPLIDLGHDVFLLRVDEAAKIINAKYGTIRFKELFCDYLLTTFINENNSKKFDFFLSYFIDNHIFPSVIDQIKKSGVPTANFSCNNTHQFYLTKNIAPHFDYNLHSEKDADEKFREIGANPVWFPMAANPKIYHPTPIEKRYDVSFIGGNYAKRSYYIWHLLENGIDVQCFGSNWLVNKPMPRTRELLRESRRNLSALKTLFSLSYEKRNKHSAIVSHFDFNKQLRIKHKEHFHYPVTDNEMIQLYSQSKISLGFLEVFDKHDPSRITKQHLHLREFEAPMCGALYFTNYCEELLEFYEPDKEIVIYRNEHELFDKVKFFLNNPDEAEKIRRAGHKRALECHTYHKRFENLFISIGLQ